MIFFLTFSLFLLLILHMGLNRNSLFSISFFSILSFLISSLVYSLLFSQFGKDISFQTAGIVLLSLIFLLTGELVGKNFTLKSKRYFKKNYRYNSNTSHYVISDIKMYIIFLLSIFVFIIRFIDLYKFSRTLGNSNIFLTLSSTRLAYALGEYSSTSVVMKFAITSTIIIEFLAYIYLYYYFYNKIIFNVNQKSLLLPFLGYLIVLATVTGRTQYIFSIIVVITVYIYLKDRINTSQLLKISFLTKIVYSGILGIILIFAYGFIFRDNDKSTTIFSTIASYLGASIYGLDSMIGKTFYGVNGKEITFGYYTFQNIHLFFNKFGNNIPIPSFHHLPFFSYKYGSSNIYTSLIFPILDFGITFTFFTRFIIGFISGKLTKILYNRNFHEIHIVKLLIIQGIFFYNGISASLADRFYGNLLKPETLIKYIIISSIVLYFSREERFSKGIQ